MYHSFSFSLIHIECCYDLNGQLDNWREKDRVCNRQTECTLHKLRKRSVYGTLFGFVFSTQLNAYYLIAF